MTSYCPSLFGNNAALQSWQVLSEILGLPTDGLVVGIRPDVKKIPITRLRKNRKSLLDSLVASDSQRKRNGPRLVMGQYLPEGILVLGWLFMEKGVVIPTIFKNYVNQAIELEKIKAERIGNDYNKKQRYRQLNRMQNSIDLYKNGTPMSIDLYRSTKGGKRAKARERKDKIDKKAIVEFEREVKAKDYIYLAEIYILLRMFHGAKKSKELFNYYIPGANHKKLLEYMLNEGMTDERNRPNPFFKEEIIAKIKDYST